MPSKSFLVKVELAIQKVSCPGVWLCSNGKVSLQVCMLDSTVQTDSHKPFFPVSFKEKFIFYKTFLKERRLSELQRALGREWICAEFIQWKSCDEGVILASFQTTLDDLLYSSSLKPSSSDVDLLMEPTKLFPGKISPKLELSTKTTIQETTLSTQKSNLSDSNLTKKSCSKHRNFVSKPQIYSRRVCHTVEYSKAQQRDPKACKKDKRPIFKYKRPEDDLILRLNPNKVTKEDIVRHGAASTRCKVERCYCGDVTTDASEEEKLRSSITNCSPFGCLCGSQHTPQLCEICSKYEGTFSTAQSNKPPPSKPQEFVSATDSLNKIRYYCSDCNNTYLIQRCPCQDVEKHTEKKVCFCIPEGSRMGNLAQRLHEKVMSTVQAGVVRIDDCLGNCEVAE